MGVVSGGLEAIGSDAARWWKEIESRQALMEPELEAAIEEWAAEARGPVGAARLEPC